MMREMCVNIVYCILRGKDFLDAYFAELLRTVIYRKRDGRKAAGPMRFIVWGGRLNHFSFTSVMLNLKGYI